MRYYNISNNIFQFCVLPSRHHYLNCPEVTVARATISMRSRFRECGVVVVSCEQKQARVASTTRYVLLACCVISQQCTALPSHCCCRALHWLTSCAGGARVSHGDWRQDKRSCGKAAMSIGARPHRNSLRRHSSRSPRNTLLAAAHHLSPQLSQNDFAPFDVC